METSPAGHTEEELKVYNELWSKLRWAIGTTFDLPYGKASDFSDLARRLALVVLDNAPFR